MKTSGEYITGCAGPGMTMRIRMGVINEAYLNFIAFLFFIFLFGVLSFGRSFSILHINFHGTKIFVTEIFLLISLPASLFYNGYQLKIPKSIKISFLAFFLLGLYHFLKGVLGHNLFALRDIVLCGYLLFLPLTLIFFSGGKTLRYFLAILIASNVINIIVGNTMIRNDYSIFKLQFLAEQIRGFNLGLYYGLSLSFLVPFLSFISDKKLKALVILLVAMDINMLISLSLRALWFAFFSLSVYFVLVRRLIPIKAVLKSILVVIPLCALLFWIDFRNINVGVRKEFLASKIKTMASLASGTSERPLDMPERSVVSCKNNKKFPAPGCGVGDKNNLEPDPPAYTYDDISFGNLAWRAQIWRQSIDFGLKSPLIGRGFGVYPDYLIRHYLHNKQKSWYMLKSPEKYDIDSGVTPAHNHIVTIFFKMGLLGLALFIFMNVYTFLYGISYVHKANDRFLKCFLIGSLGAFVFWHTAALFFDVIDSPPTNIFLWVIMGLIFTAVETVKIQNRGREAKQKC